MLNRNISNAVSVFPTATVPELICGDIAVKEPSQILNFLRKQVRDACKGCCLYINCCSVCSQKPEAEES